MLYLAKTYRGIIIKKYLVISFMINFLISTIKCCHVKFKNGTGIVFFFLS